MRGVIQKIGTAMSTMPTPGSILGPRKIEFLEVKPAAFLWPSPSLMGMSSARPQPPCEAAGAYANPTTPRENRPTIAR